MEEEQIPRSEVDPNPPSRDPEGHDLRMDGVGSKMMHYSTTPPLQPAVVLYVVLYSLPYFPTPLRDADTHKGCTPGTRPHGYGSIPRGPARWSASLDVLNGARGAPSNRYGVPSEPPPLIW